VASDAKRNKFDVESLRYECDRIWPAFDQFCTSLDPLFAVFIGALTIFYSPCEMFFCLSLPPTHLPEHYHNLCWYWQQWSEDNIAGAANLEYSSSICQETAISLTVLEAFNCALQCNTQH
jgi:hypothetical protein